MARRAANCLRIDRGVRGTRLIVTPPVGCDAAMRRDGVTSRRGGGLAEDGRPDPPPARRCWPGPRCVHGPVSSAGRRNRSSPCRPDAWAPVLFTGWSRAAMAQRDQDWMTALVDWALAGGPTGNPVRRGDRCANCPGGPIRRAARGRRRPTRPREIPPPIRDAISVLRFRFDMLKELEL